MLVRSKADFQKIIMGLLSYSPELNSTKQLLDEMEWYRQNDQRRIYLYQEEESEDFIGLVGIEIEETIIIVRRLTMTPSYLNENHEMKMLEELAELFEDKTITSTLQTSSYVTAWKQSAKD